ncbi:DUF3558 domain-containing protein [Allokutzneria sp. A3M-2-11 16]|uniref:DUF3558 domain-containing protein n=1 Tax=Allokutzneria sp. A3M-2-11 16 TaxID=2962043 RepID=UPI0020B7812E|nr:DUF3558 domain-containing protein [Allokutzneria sp. A3M-2-11 16]MCP3798211.1 DUF3558 domain-containing protein [Allokutzneria sp. A3M-2-11 16]
MSSWGSRFLVTFAVASIALSAGCASSVTGEPVAAPGAEEQAKKAKGKIDAGSGPVTGLGGTELAARKDLDPCALFPKEHQDKLGKPSKYVGGATKVDLCVVGIEVWDGDGPQESEDGKPAPTLGVVDIELDASMFFQDEDRASTGSRGKLTKEQRDDVTVYSGEEKRICTRRLVFKDKSMVNIEVTTRNNDTRAEPCESAETVVSSVLKVLRSGPVARRTLPANSLLGIDVCGLVSPDAVTAALGATPPRHPGLGFRGCMWSADPKSIKTETLAINVTTNLIPRAGDQMVKEIAPIAGRPSTTTQLPFAIPGAPIPCTVEVTHIPFEPVPGKKETLSVMVVSSAGAEASCQKARAAAEVIAPKLPAM